jgi:hypothetical protein
MRLVIYVKLLPHYNMQELSYLLFTHIVACEMFVIRSCHDAKVRRFHNLFNNLLSLKDLIFV